MQIIEYFELQRGGMRSRNQVMHDEYGNDSFSAFRGDGAQIGGNLG